MDTKEQLIKTIKEWLKNDNEIRILKKEIQERKKQNEEISKILIETMKIHDINRFDMTGGGKLIYAKKNVKKPINKQLLQNLISKFHGDENLGHELSNFIYDNREQSVKEIILHKPATVAASTATATEKTS